MGRPKAGLPLYPGSDVTFLQRLEKVTRGLGCERAVVTSLPPGDLRIDLPHVLQENPEKGQLSSLLLGWEAFGGSHPWVMVCLVDHPYVSRTTLERLVRFTRETPEAMMWSLSHQRRGGHPAVFSRHLMSRLAKAPLEEGARPVVRALGTSRRFLEVEDPAVLWDVDTPRDYDQFASLFQAARV